MTPSNKEKRKKPKVKYSISKDGNVIDASIDEDTHFISIRRTVGRKKKGGLGLSFPGFRGEAETQQKDEWLTVVWEKGTLMPPSVWNKKRKKELLETVSATISEATNCDPKDLTMSADNGTVVPWTSNLDPLSYSCPRCGEDIYIGGDECFHCGWFAVYAPYVTEDEEWKRAWEKWALEQRL